MKILVTGSDGFSGSNFCRKARKRGHQVLGTDINPWFKVKGCQFLGLDMISEGGCLNMCRTYKPDVIINAARAPGNLGHCEKKRYDTYQINVRGMSNMARGAEEVGAKFVFLSSDWIFDGRINAGERYIEESKPCPLNYYGVTKLTAEHVIREICTNWLIIRPAHFYGFHAALLDAKYNVGMSPLDKTVWSNIGASLQIGKKMQIPSEMYQTPILVSHLVEITLDLIQKDVRGIFHVADCDSLSRYQVVRSVIETLGLGAELIIQGSMLDFAQAQDIPRDFVGILPVNTALEVNKVESVLDRKMKTFAEGLVDMKKGLEKANLMHT
jgi:dTDP-4-dehydrorhamnose reductase